MRDLIEVVVSDRVVAETRIKQKARFYGMLHTQEANGVCLVKITLIVSLYAADSSQPDGFGERLTSAGFSDYERVLSADNSCLVDATNGQVLAIRSTQTDAEWQAVMAGFSQPTALQGDFFEYLRDNGLPGTIRQMIEHHIAQADALGRFA